MPDETMGKSSRMCVKGHESAVTLFGVRNGFAGGSFRDFRSI